MKNAPTPSRAFILLLYTRGRYGTDRQLEIFANADRVMDADETSLVVVIDWFAAHTAVAVP